MLVLDELGYAPFSTAGAELLFEVVSRAYERTSLMVTTNLPFEYFDAARSYGRAEEFLANWLAVRGIGPDEVTIGSKWGYTYTAGWQVEAERHEVKDHSLAALLR